MPQEALVVRESKSCCAVQKWYNTKKRSNPSMIVKKAEDHI